MSKVNSAIGIVVVVVAVANVSTIRAQSDESPRRLQEQVSRTTVGGVSVSAVPFLNTEKKIIATDGAHLDRFGESVAVSGDTTIVGSDGDDDRTGAAYVYQRDHGGVDHWGEVRKLTASDRAVEDFFGGSVAISGDTVVVGAQRDANDNGEFAGAAYVYGRNEGGIDNWGEVKKLIASDGERSDRFGRSVAISGDTVIVGAYKNIRSGTAYVYGRNEGGIDNWGEVTKLIPSDGNNNDQFGRSVAISGDTVIVGAVDHGDTSRRNGAAYLYQRHAGGVDNWGEVRKHLPTNAETPYYGEFGESVSISGDTAVVSEDGCCSKGTVYIYQRDEGGVDNWGELTTVTGSDELSPGAWGRLLSVAISGDTMIMGAYEYQDDGPTKRGSAYVYRRDEGGVGNWGELTKITASDREYNDQFGHSVAISGETMMAGARYESGVCREGEDCVVSGSAYIYFTSLCSNDGDCTDGLPCNGDEVCVTETGECLPGTPVACDDGDSCNGFESCDPPTGECIDGPFIDCDANGVDDGCDIAEGRSDVNANGIPDGCEAPCATDATCDDGDRCSSDRCVDSLCFNDLDVLHGDMVGPGGVCGPDGDVNLNDILAILNAFAGLFPDGCGQADFDIVGYGGDCYPNDQIDLNDILGILDAFSGLSDCCPIP